jgi:hypothetical protein
VTMDLREVRREVVVRIYPVAGYYKHGNETSGSIKGGKFIDWLSKY